MDGKKFVIKVGLHTCVTAYGEVDVSARNNMTTLSFMDEWGLWNRIITRDTVAIRELRWSM